MIAAEAPTFVRDILEQRPETIGEEVRGRLQAGLEVKASEYIRALEQRRVVERAYEQAIAAFDAFVLPTSPVTAEPIDAAEQAALKFRNTGTFDNTRQPTTSVPNGFDSDGLPTSLMVAAAQFNHAMALRIAHTYQQATDFHTRRPGPLGKV